MTDRDTTPRFEHDCDECVFIARIGRHDLYRCPQGGFPTIVARWGDDGPEYTSWPVEYAQFAPGWNLNCGDDRP